MLVWAALLILAGSILAFVAWPVELVLVEVVAPILAVAAFTVICAIEALQ